MADPADVVPLRRGGSAPFCDPVAVFADMSDPTRGLSVTWSSDQQTIRLGIEAPDQSSDAVVLSAEELLDLVQALMDGLPRSGGGSSDLAPVLPLRPRQSHPFTADS